MAEKESEAPPQSLLLRLKRKWFDAIVGGYKVQEYRKASEYWRSRIENRTYDAIMFRNGYGATRPTVLVEYKGWDRVRAGDEDFYSLRLGKTLKMWNFELPQALPNPSQCSAIGLCPTSEEMDQQLRYYPLHRMWLPRDIPQLTLPVDVVPLGAAMEEPTISIPLMTENAKSPVSSPVSAEVMEDVIISTPDEITFSMSHAPADPDDELATQTINLVEELQESGAR